MKNNLKVYCNECKQTKDSKEFYTRLVDIGGKNETVYCTDVTEISKNTHYHSTENKTNGICKNCFMEKYFKNLNDNNGDIQESIHQLCKEFDLPYDKKNIENLIYNENSCSSVLKTYIRNISSLPHYNKVGFDTHKVQLGEEGSKAKIVVSNSGRELFSISEDGIEEKSDIDFLNDDIKRIKINITKALENDDVNAHGKWLNSLRDALELRNKLERKGEIYIPSHRHTFTTNDGQSYTTSESGGSVISLSK